MAIQEIKGWIATTDNDYLKRFFGLKTNDALALFITEFLFFIETHCFPVSTNIQAVLIAFNEKDFA